MKKKLVALTLSLVLALSLAACGGKEEKADTAETEATTEVAEEPVAAAETTEEASPVEEEPEPEVAEEAPEEVEEEPLPTTASSIWTYLDKNGKPGDYMVSEDNYLIAYPFEQSSLPNETPVENIDGKWYLVRSMYVINRAQTSGSDRVETLKSYLFVEKTDEEDTFKIEIRLPDGTIDHLKNDIQPEQGTVGEYRPFIRFGNASDTVWDISIEDFTNDKIQILIKVDHDSPAPYDDEIFRVIHKKIYDINDEAAVAALQAGVTFYTNYHPDYDLGMDYTVSTDYTIVTD